MHGLKLLYIRSGWYEVFNFANESAKARSFLLMQVAVAAVISGFTGGVYYTGYLIGHGIDIVNISILTLIPYAACLFSLLTPYILERFPKRRWILSIARVAHYLLQILGVSLLPLVIKDPDGRVVGLVILVFVANAINFLFSGYSPWHMPYITPNVRMQYFTATNLVSNVTGTVVMLITSTVTDRLAANDQLQLISVLRYVALGMAALDVYLLQRPKEPVYLKTANRPKLLDIFRLPLSNKKFMLSMGVMFLFHLFINISYSVQNAWLLQEVGTGYLYLQLISAFYMLFIMFTSKFWTKVAHKLGTFPSLALTLLLLAPTYLVFAFVNNSNFLWLMTIVRLGQHGVSMLQTYSSGNVIYISLPEKDQTNYTSFNTIITNLSIFLSLSIGTAVVAIMGDTKVNIFGARLGAVPLLLFFTGVLMLILVVVIMLLRKKLPQDNK